MMSPETINKNFQEILENLGLTPQDNMPGMEVEEATVDVKEEKWEIGNHQGKSYISISPTHKY